MTASNANVIWSPLPGSQQLVLTCPYDELLYEGTRGPGKGLPLDEPVLTPEGFRRIGDVTVGSRVCAHDGTVSKVIGVYPQGLRPTYEIEFDDGAIARCDDQHIWPIRVQSTQIKRGFDYRLMGMSGVLRNWQAGRRLHIPTLEGVALTRRMRLREWPVNPYVLGLLLGDGSMNAAGDVRYCTVDAALADAVIAGGFVEYAPDKRNGLRCFGVKRSSAVAQGIKRLGLLKKRSWEKSVPGMYKEAPAADRLAILQGLMDTDGSIDARGYIEFCSSSEQLAMDVVWLVRSLGGKASVTTKKTVRRLAYRVYVQTGRKFIPFRLQRKAERMTQYQHETLSRRIVDIRALGQQETVCIKVDHPLGLFITRDFVVTHNTDTLLMDFAQDVGQGFEGYWRGVIFRREYKHLEDIVSRSKRWFRQIFPQARFLASKGDYKWVFPDGEELLFRAFKNEDDYWSYHGHEYPYIGWDELTGWPDIKPYDSMKSCNRSSYQPKNGGRAIPLKIRGTTNPYGRGHNWVKKHFISPASAGVPIIENGRTRVRIFGSMKENPFLDPNYINTIRSVKDPNKRKAWGDGSWDVTSGGMLDDIWDERVHVVQPFDIPPGWRIKRCLDWGFSRPFSVGWWAESSGSQIKTASGTLKTFPRGTWFRIAEWYGSTGQENEGLRLTAKSVAEGIRAREAQFPWGQRIKPGAADSSIFDTDDSTSVADNMAAAGIKWTHADKRAGSRKAGADKLRTLLESSLTRPMESPGIFIFNTCRKWIELVPIVPRDESNPDDIDSDCEDHNYDETRYAVTERAKTSTIRELTL